jgi:DNA-binding HxlR family transcriptional regulator
MIAAPFRMSLPPVVTSSVELAPVYNALTSLALLNVAEQVTDVEPWIRETAAALTPEERQRNRLVFEGLGEVLLPDREWASFPAYLDHLASEPATVLCARWFQGLVRPTRDRTGSLSIAALGDLLADKANFLQQVAVLAPGQALDQAVLSEVYALLNDPAALQQLVVSHLRGLWDKALAAEWARHEQRLQGMVTWLRRRPLPPAPAAETIRTLIGRELPREMSAQLDGVQHIVCVLSPHIGPYAARFGSETTLWLFLRGRREELQRVRRTPIKREELVAPLSALADDTRLHILELLTRRGEVLAQELITELDLSQSSVSRHLKQLVSTGFLIERRSEGANKSYRLDPARVDWVFMAVKNLLSGTAASEEPEITEAVDLRADVRRFLNANGRLVSWPAKRKDQLPVLAYLATRFEPGREYSEKEVNALLNQWHDYNDPAILRRSLYDEGLLGRTSDGSRYWRISETMAAPVVAE